MAASRPYADTMRKVIGHLANGNLEYKHPYLEERDVKRVGYLVVSTDRGLCGGLNINLFKKLLAEMKAWSDKGVQCDLAMIGSKGVSFFNAVGGNVVAQVTGMGDNPSLSELIGPVKVMLQAYDEGRLDKLYVVSNKFINTMSQVPTITQLLPLPASEDADLKRKSSGLPVRTRSESAAGYPPASLCRISGLSGRGRKPGQRAGRTYGGDESRDRQWRQPD